MREIKLRIRLESLIDKKKLTIYSELNNDQNGLLQHPIELDKWKILSIDEYIDLKDKNGKEIYEGDILRDESGNVYDPVSYNVYWKQYDIEYTNWAGTKAIGQKTQTDLCEVIGNIHENPELLD